MELHEVATTELDYPTNLDVVVWKDDYYQVAGTGRNNNPKKDFFYINSLTQNPQTIKVGDGAVFNRFKISKDLPKGYIYRKDECVRVTGEIVGGKQI